MDPIQALVLGLVQGLTEFIPVSSSAHLIIVPWLLGWPDPGLAFDAALHLGTLAAVLVYFARDWVVLARAFLASLVERRLGTDHNRLLAWLVLVGSIPGAIAGVFCWTTRWRSSSTVPARRTAPAPCSSWRR